jgi:hypothetical protein
MPLTPVQGRFTATYSRRFTDGWEFGNLLGGIMALQLQVLSGHVPATLGDVVTFTFNPGNFVATTGLLLYMINTRQGNRGYRIDLNGKEGDLFSLPPGSHFATLAMAISPIGFGVNTLQFVSVGPSEPPMDILHVVVLFDDTLRKTVKN